MAIIGMGAQAKKTVLASGDGKTKRASCKQAEAIVISVLF